MNNARIRRGRRSQDLVAQYYRDSDWPSADSTAASLKGKDIRNMRGLAPEVKARRDFSPLAWVKQAEKNADPLESEVPYVVLRCDGQGEESVGDWLVIMRMRDHRELLLDAAYGEHGWKGRLPC